MLRHYILTRYNYGLYSDNPYNVTDPEVWMEHRWPLFEVCAHSIESQINQNFSWIISVDPKTPKYWVDKIHNLTGATVITQIPQLYMRDLEINTEWVATTRLDNDDYYFPTFTHEIQSNFAKRKEILDINYLALDLDRARFFTSGRWKPNSPFITLIEEAGDLDTVFEYAHSHVLENYRCRFVVEEEPLAVQVVHEENVSNKIRGQEV
tara:strand:- start:3945 stop:4568 length:624 start_codon:yes stop_codon:yes gene_type:complete